MDGVQTTTRASAFNVKGLVALGHVVGNFTPDMIPVVDDDALNSFFCETMDRVMDIESASLQDLEWKLRNFSGELEGIDDLKLEEMGHPALRRWADLLRADILRLIGTEQTDPDAPVLDAFRAWADICRQHRAKFKAEDVPDDVADRMCSERQHLWRTLMALPAATAAGVAAKAYAAADFHGDGIEAPEDDDHTYEAEAARAIIADAKRLLPADILGGMAS